MRRILLTCTILLAACSDVPPARTLTYYFTAEPRALDPALSTDVPTGEVVAMVFDNLTQFDAEGGLGPGLATRWEPDSTGAVWTFHLRQGAVFHDGTPVTAERIHASLLRALAPGTTGGRSWPLHPIRGARAYADGKARDVEGLRIVDDSTLRFVLEEPLNLFPKFLAMPVTAIVPAPVGPAFDQGPVGSGPWRFVRWSHDDEIVLAANENWWGGRPGADSLRIRIIPEPLTQAAEYEAGNLSVVEVPLGETRRWEERHADELQRRPGLKALYVAINTTRGPLRDVRVRRALNHAVDVPALLETVMGGRGVAAAGAIPPGLVGHDSSRARYRHDPAEARRLLAEAGHADGLSLRLWRTQRAELARVAQVIQQALSEVGVSVEIVERDASSARAAARKGETDLFLTDWWGDYPDPENFIYPLFHSANRGTGGNYAYLSDPVLDSMVLRARATTDSAEQRRLYAEADRRVFDAAPWIFLWFPVDLWAMRPEVEGWSFPAIFSGQRWANVAVRQ